MTRLFTLRVVSLLLFSLCSSAVLFAQPNNKPVAVDDHFSILEDASQVFNVRGNDTDDGPLNSPVIILPAAHGTATVNASGNVVYVPDTNYNGIDTFVYSVCDTGTPALCDTATVYLTIVPVNDKPVATDDHFSILEDATQVFNVRGNDTDDGPLNSPFIIVPAAHGTATVNASGNVVYVPDTNYNGIDTFVYAVCDTGTPVLCDTATVYLTIVPVNDAPVAVNDRDTTSQNIPVVIDVRANDSDVEGPLNDPAIIGVPAHGTAVVNADGTITYTPATNYSGMDTLAYAVCDTGTPVLCDTAVVYILVNQINIAPVAVNDSSVTSEGAPVVIVVKANDSDADGTIGTPAVVSPSAHGMAVVNTDGTITYSPDSSYYGVDSFSYTICDNGTPSLCDTAWVYITVTPVSNGPTITVTPVELDADTSKTVCLAYTIDPLSSASDLTVSLCGNDTSKGTVTYIIDTVNGTVCITYHAKDVTGAMAQHDSVCLTLCDQVNANCSTVSIPVTIDPLVRSLWVKGFSPNGDKNNDFFTIPAADLYPNASVHVFNRWGDEVWYNQQPGYVNDDASPNNFKGNNSQGNVLPDGTYYYVFDFHDGTGKKPVVKFVVIDRGQ